MAQVIYTGVTNGTDVKGSLFQGQKFWLSQRVPSRTTFIEQVKANGGEIVPLEKQADIKIVDHVRKDAVPGAHSYQYIEKSIRNGKLESLDDHRAGPPTGTARPVGAIDQPAKSTRAPFTAEDDRILYDWCVENERNGRRMAGNEVYKQLWEINKRHPWQSWRDRWLSHLAGKPRQPQVVSNAPPTPPTDPAEASPREEMQEEVTEVPKSPEPPESTFIDEDAQALLAVATDLLDVLDENKADAWQEWAKAYPQRSAEEWQKFWEQKVCPIYLKKQAVEAKKKTDVTTRASAVKQTRLEPSSTESDSPESSSKNVSAGGIQGVNGTNKHEPAMVPPSNMNFDTLDLPNTVIHTEPYRSPKRKRVEIEDQHPTSSPPSLSTSKAAKRLRADRGDTIPEEIPSTPERSSLSARRQLDMLIKQEIIDLAGDGSSESQEEEPDTEEDDDEASFPERAPSQSLSEPRPTPIKLFNAVKGPRRRLDFDLPSPEGGWDDDGQGRLEEPEIIETKPSREDTQAILRGQTPMFDFTVVEPDEGWDALLPPPPSSPPVQASSQNTGEDIADARTPEVLMDEEEMIANLEKWIDARIESGFDIEAIELALKSTNNELDLADIVLNDVKEYGNLPTDVKGIWTEEDDEYLEAVDARKVNAIIKKHGQEGVDKRYEFLKTYNAAD